MGETNGQDDMFVTSNKDVDTKPTANPPTYDGDLMPGDPGALPGGGGQGQTIDNLACNPDMTETYHVHVFVGIYVNGVQYAVPDAVGIFDAGGDTTYNSIPNQTVYGKCYYDVHTHDASGTVHLESASTAPITTSIFTLGNVFDIWGLQFSGTQLGPYGEMVTVYQSGNSATIPCHTIAQCEVGSTQYQLWTGDPTQIPLYGHEVIWIEVGPGPPPNDLPGIDFTTET